MKLEKRLWASPALAEARRQKLAYEKLRLLATLPEKDIAAWTPRAHARTVAELRFRIEGERERQMRGKRTFSVALPRRTAVLLSAAVETIRRRAGERLPLSKCLAILGAHFFRTWDGAVKGKSRAQRIRERDEGRCQVPGCSHPADHAHHIELRSEPGGVGGREPPDLETGNRRLLAARRAKARSAAAGEAPDHLRWSLRGKPWNGPLPVDAAP